MTVDWQSLTRWGFSVFPLKARDKRPSMRWEEFQSRLPSDDELRRWSAASSTNAAIVTGSISGVIVLDTDSAEADAEVARLGVPETPTARTSKGRHYYFAHPGGQVRNFARKLDGCDLRGDGGYVVAPGSTHPSGHLYAWERTPDEVPFAPAPAWLLELTRKPAAPASNVGTFSPYVEKAVDAELSTLRRAGEGTRNNTLNRCAYNLGQLVGGGALDQVTAERHLLGTALAIGLSEEEARRTIASGLASGLASPRGIPERRAVGGGRFAPVVQLDAERERRAQHEAPPALATIDPVRWQDQPVPERAWRVPEWLPDGAVTSLYGDGGLGKSLVAQQLITAAATSRPWLGLPVTPCRTLGVFCEDPADELHRRQAAINADLGVDMGDLENMLLVSRVADENLLMTFDHDGRGQPTPLMQAVAARAKEFGAQLVVIDPAADCFGGNENIRNQVRQFIAMLTRLAMDIGGAVLLCAHPSVDGLRSGHGFAGSTAWNNSVRSRLYLDRPPCDSSDDDSHPSTTEERVLSRKKANYAGAGEAIKLVWRDGVLKAASPPGGLFASIAKQSAERVFLDCLAILAEQGRNVSDVPNSGRYAPKVMTKLPEAKGHNASDLRRAMERLFAERKIRLERVGSPSNSSSRIVINPAP